MNKIGFLFAASALSVSCQATTLSRVTLAELTMHSDIVVYVEIVAGKVLPIAQVKEGALPCGAEYEGMVLKTLKGDAGSTLRFGYYAGYGIGNRMVLFLNRKDKLFEPLDSSNSMSMQAMDAQQKACQAHWPVLLVNHSGIGALKVEPSAAFDYRDAVLVPGRYVAMPAGVKSIPAPGAIAWVGLDAFLDAVQNTK